MNLIQLREYIAPEFICKVVTPLNLDYSDIRLICGEETVFIDNCIYIGNLSDIPAEMYRDKLIGLITTQDTDDLETDIDYIMLSKKTNILALYEQLKDLWNHNNVGNIITILSKIFTSTSLKHIIKQTSLILKNPVFMLDYNSTLLTYYCEQTIDDPEINYLLEHGTLPLQYVKERRCKEVSKMLLTNPTPIIVDADGVNTTHKRLLGMIWVNQRSQAMISVLEYKHKLTMTDCIILGNICAILSQQIERRAHYSRQTNILSVLYESRLIALINQEEQDLLWVPDWLSYMHWERYQNFHLVVIQNADLLHNQTQIIEITGKLRKQLANRGVFLYEKGIIILLNIKDLMDFQQIIEVLTSVLSEYNLNAGISKRFSDIQMLNEYYRQAEAAVRMDRLLGHQNVVSIFDKQIPYHLIQAAQAHENLNRFDDYRLDLLNKHDLRFGTDYYHTFYTYLQHACNRTQAAHYLCISRNTMDYRMNKIRELLNLSDHDGDECMKLYLAFKIRELEKANVSRNQRE